MAARTKVSVVVVAYDRRDFIAEALDSVADQDLDPALFDVVVCTNLPRTSLESHLDSSRVTVLNLPPGNWGEWIVAALPRCRGEVLCFLDDDDRFEPTKLSCVCATFERHPSVGYFHNRVRRKFQARGLSDAHRVEDGHDTEGPGLGLLEDRHKSRRRVDQLFWSGGGFNASAMAVRREVLASLGSLASELEVGHPLALFYAAALGAWDLYFEPTPLTLYRVHSTNSSTPTGSDVRTEFRRAVERGRSVVRDSERIARFIDSRGQARVSSAAVRSVGTRTRLLRSLSLPDLSRKDLLHGLGEYLSLTPPRIVADQRGMLAAIAFALVSPRQARAWLGGGRAAAET